MANKTILVFVTVIVLTILVPALGFSQNIGLQIGVAQGQQFGHHHPGPRMAASPIGPFLPPVQPPAIATHGTFARLSPFPIPPPPLPTIATTPFPLVPNFPT